MLCGKMRLQDLRRLYLQGRGYREMDIALAAANAFDSRIVRLPAVPQQGQEFAVVVADGIERLARAIPDGDHPPAIVIPLKTDGRIAFDERAVRSAPVGARADVSEDVESQCAEWVASRFGTIAGLIDIDAQRLVLVPVPFQFRPAARGKRQPGAVVN